VDGVMNAIKELGGKEVTNVINTVFNIAGKVA
jgi:hypothetical protein